MKYQIHKGSKYYGATTVFENIQFEIRNTEKIAIVGRNGCGKTTLLRVIAETEVLDAGENRKEETRINCGSAIWHRRPSRMRMSLWKKRWSRPLNR